MQSNKRQNDLRQPKKFVEKSPLGGVWRLYVAACLMILVAAVAVRLGAARGDLWLDEIWSWRTTSHISSPLEVFTKLHLDNNHYLNTLYLYYVGLHGTSLEYRALSLLAGIGAVAMAWLVGRRHSAAAGLLTMLLTAFSYMMILYSSEARGYIAAVFFALLAFYLLDRHFETKRWWLALLFSLSVAMGFLSHLTFLSFYLAALLWMGYRLMKARPGFRQIAMTMLLCNAIPLALLATLYFVDVRHLTIVGGTSPLFTPLNVYGSALAWALGTPSADYAILWVCIAAVVILDIGLRMLWPERPDLAVFFVGAIVVFPVLLIVGSKPNTLFVRYFVVAIAFFLILLGFVLAELYRRGPWGKATCATLLLAFVAANGWHTAGLLERGRGQYTAAIRFMLENTSEPVVTIGTDFTTWAEPLLTYHGQALLGKKKIQLFGQESPWPLQGVAWIIKHGEPSSPPVPSVTEITDSAGNRYDFVKAYLTGPLSGQSWFLYHNRALGKPATEPAGR